jgi:Endonuclease-reverse transcriptase
VVAHWDIHHITRKKIRRTRLINVYDNIINIGPENWQNTGQSRRAIEDINWQMFLGGRVVLLGDFNAYSSLWDPFQTRNNAGPLEDIIAEFGLILNNEPGAITRPAEAVNSCYLGSIIDLTFITPEIRLLESWAIDIDHPTPSDHELIVFQWLNKEEAT